MTPAKWAAPPAPAMITRTPRSDAVRANSAVASGVRCADNTRASLGTPSSSSVSAAFRIVSQSDLLPIIIATSGFDSAIFQFGRAMPCRNFFSSERFGGIFNREYGQIDRPDRNDGRRQIVGRPRFGKADRSQPFGHR